MQPASVADNDLMRGRGICKSPSYSIDPALARTVILRMCLLRLLLSAGD